MSGKRYYWLKLYSDVFSSLRLKKLRKLAGGDTFFIIYLKMLLIAIKNDGIIKWKGIENNFADELALELDEQPDNVQVTLAYLLSCGLAETDDNVSFFFPYAVANTGSETSAAERMRKMRGRNNVTPMLQERYGEIEIEKEIEKELDNNSFSEEKINKKEDVSTTDRAARIEHFVELILFAERYGYDKTGTYNLASAEGITREEIDEARRKKP